MLTITMKVCGLKKTQHLLAHGSVGQEFGPQLGNSSSGPTGDPCRQGHLGG